MNEITVSAKTLDDAITEASIQLGVASDQMEYDVIEKGSAGFLGIGSRQAVIRARIKKTVTEEIKAEEIKPEEIKKEFKKDFRKDRKEFVGHKERKEYKEHKEYKKDSKKDFKKEPKKEFVKENKTEIKELQHIYGNWIKFPTDKDTEYEITAQDCTITFAYLSECENILKNGICVLNTTE